jgi:hypothetical protein
MVLLRTAFNPALPLQLFELHAPQRPQRHRCPHNAFNSFILSRTRSSPHNFPSQPLASRANPHQPAERVLNRWVGDSFRGRPNVQWLYSSSLYGSVAIAAVQRDAVSTAVPHQHEASLAPLRAAAATCMRCLEELMILLPLLLLHNHNHEHTTKLHQPRLELISLCA